MERFLKQFWWKIIGIGLLMFAIVSGLWIPLYYGVAGLSFPNLPILNESIRNLLFHVPMWFSMVFLLLLSFI